MDFQETRYTKFIQRHRVPVKLISIVKGSQNGIVNGSARLQKKKKNKTHFHIFVSKWRVYVQ